MPQKETLNFVSFHVVKSVPSAPGHSQKRELSPGAADCQISRNYRLKYVNSVSCVTQLYSVQPVVNAPNVVQNLPVGARLQSFWKTWLNLGAGPKVVQILREGYTLPFRIRPQLTRSPSVISRYVNPHRNSYLLEALHQLIDKNAVERVQNPKSLGFFNRLFLVPKPNNKWRPILGLSKLNLFLKVEKFKMETPETIRTSLQQGEWVTSVDFKDAYFHIPIQEQSRRYLRFHVQDRTYQFKALPFGLSTVPMEFTVLAKEVKLMAIHRGIRSLSLKRVPKSLCRQNSSGSNRQYYSGSLHKQGRRHEVGPTLCPTVENLDLVFPATSNSKTRHIPGRLNVIADKLSRLGQTIQTEWSLLPEVFQQICNQWHRPQIDLFATRFNHKLPQFVSPVPDSLAVAVDALTLPWDDLDAYAFPPTAILGKVVQKLLDSPCKRLILIATGWPNMPWFWHLVTMSSQVPLSLPKLLTQPFNQIPHRNLTNLNLHAWLLEPRKSKNRASLRQWQQELRLLKEDRLDQSMRQSGPFLQNGASLIRWTSGHHL